MRPGLARVATAVLTLVAVAAGAAYAGTSATTAKVTKVAIATPAKDNDYGWNQQGVRAAKVAATAFGASLTSITDIGYDKTDVVLRQLAQSGAGLIIAHASGYDTIAARIAQQYHVPIITYDIPTMLTKGYVSNITTSSEQGSYLAGILAARSTRTGTIGIVISAADTNWYKMSGGFAAGVRSVSKTDKLLFATISPTGYDDSAGGKRVAGTLIASGADVIFGMGDDASFGYLQSIETAKAGHKVWYIGDIGDMTPIDKNHVLLSSVLWNFTNAYKAAISDIEHGKFGTRGYNLTLQNGGISLLKTRYIPQRVWSEILKAQGQIISGKLKVPVATTKGAVQNLLK
jgi:simple sugar transport system substrate-binding protein